MDALIAKFALPDGVVNREPALAELVRTSRHVIARCPYRSSVPAERALQMSNEMGYHWGKVDAEEVLERMNAEG